MLFVSVNLKLPTEPEGSVRVPVPTCMVPELARVVISRATLLVFAFNTVPEPERIRVPSMSRADEAVIVIPEAIERLFRAWVALIVLPVVDMVMVEPVFVQLDVIVTSPEALIAVVAEDVNVPPVWEKSAVLSVPDMV